MHLIEVQIPLPWSTEQFAKGEAYCRQKYLQQSDIISRIDAAKDVFYTNTQGKLSHYTLKEYQATTRFIPDFIVALLPGGIKLVEECWDEYPRARSLAKITTLGDRFLVAIDTLYKTSDEGPNGNVFRLSPQELSMRQFRRISLPRNDSAPQMFVHKLLRVEFAQWGLQVRVEKFVVEKLIELWIKMYGSALDWKDEWINGQQALKSTKVSENDTAPPMGEIPIQLRVIPGQKRRTRAGLGKVLSAL